MRETHIECDHCHDRVSGDSVKANLFGHYHLGIRDSNETPAGFAEGDLCDDCLSEFRMTVKAFFEAPRKG